MLVSMPYLGKGKNKIGLVPEVYSLSLKYVLDLANCWLKVQPSVYW